MHRISASLYYEGFMRPLQHPEIRDVPLQAILHALADPVRVKIFADITQQECPRNCTAFANVADKAIPKSTLSQHFRILREAGLIRSKRDGVEMQNTSRAAEVDAHYPGLLAAIAKAYEIQRTGQARRQKRAKKQNAGA
jgi:DNA-binding transcriptional ArsR family regulator